jgi:non-homologous end joining protein Ku
MAVQIVYRQTEKVVQPMLRQHHNNLIIHTLRYPTQVIQSDAGIMPAEYDPCDQYRAKYPVKSSAQA